MVVRESPGADDSDKKSAADAAAAAADAGAGAGVGGDGDDHGSAGSGSAGGVGGDGAAAAGAGGSVSEVKLPSEDMPSFDEWKQKEQEKNKNSSGLFYHSRLLHLCLPIRLCFCTGLRVWLCTKYPKRVIV